MKGVCFRYCLIQNTMKHTYSISGARLSLAPLEEENIQTVRIWRNRDDIRMCFVSRDIISEEQQLNWYKAYLKKPDDYVFQIIENSTQKVIGMCSLYNISHKDMSAEFGRLMIGSSDARGKGYGSEAVRLALDIGFQQLKLTEIHLEVLRNNSAALNTYLKCGFSPCSSRTTDVGEMIDMTIHK